ncbi:MAG: imidazole glycerol phosphate synthase subunit HisH [Candidatus Lokiarchaeota archaeon]|jgi:glutamine amidotransferase|nr:imidazole glycerol phosphate synthase subunit HisH [Candidatus Lokiarchaeota archaeon]
MITIIDYGVGNLRSVQRALQRYYPNVIISNEEEQIKKAIGIVLPGVGAFGDAIEELKRKKIFNLLKLIIPTKPTLGICLGMQLLLNKSEESPGAEGLGIVSGDVKKLEIVKSIRVPHTGWNRVTGIKEPYFSGYAYFNHTYYCDVVDESIVTAFSLHGMRFCVIFHYGTILALQFHPEKSKTIGETILKYWVKSLLKQVN